MEQNLLKGLRSKSEIVRKNFQELFLVMILFVVTNIVSELSARKQLDLTLIAMSRFSMRTLLK